MTTEHSVGKPRVASDAPVYLGLDHVQLTIPPGAEEEALAFYVAVLGMAEAAKPEALRGRGGVWLRCGPHEVHLGVEERQADSRRHPGVLVESLAPLLARLAAAGIVADVDRPPERPGFERVHVRDPFGNRIEFLERTGT